MKDMLDFLDRSPSRFHAVDNLRRELEGAGYESLFEGRTWKLTPGGKYYAVRGGSALIAFRLPEAPAGGFMISASHSDAPTFRVKENAELAGPEGYLRLNTERYGGMLCAPWLDRPLTVAGRVLARAGDAIETRLVYVDRDLLMIPNVAIHMNRSANDGFKYDPKCDMVPLMGLGAEKGAFRAVVAESAGCAPEDILGTDLFLCPRQKAVVWGVGNGFVSSPRLDDLQCAWGCFRGFMAAEDGTGVPVFALLDNEEVGSLTRQGADGTFLADVLERVCAALGMDRAAATANSFLVSADNAHAVHPNHPEKTDKVNCVYMNEGIVVKSNAAQSYTSDAVGVAIFKAICQKAGVPVQFFANRSDERGGGTLGNIAMMQVSMNSVDIGLPQLAMHSPYETAGVKDSWYMIQAVETFYSCHLVTTGDGNFRLEE